MPTNQAFREFIRNIDPNAVVESAGIGRLDRRVIYKISNDEVVVIIDEPEKATPKKKNKKKKNTKSSKKTNTKSLDKTSAIAKMAKRLREKQKQEVVTKD